METDEPGTVRGTLKMTFREAASLLLREHGPMHYRDLTDAIVRDGLVHTTSKTPEATLNASITADLKRKGSKSFFVRIRSGVFGLRELHEHIPKTTPASKSNPANSGVDEAETGNDDAKLRVRIPLFPVYSEVRNLLRVWPGYPQKQVTSLRANIRELMGTPQKTVDWTDPATWIPKRLKGEYRELAQVIWDRSKHTVNPRHTYGHWLLAQKYNLLCVGGDGVLELTEKGRDFLEHQGGKAESAIDKAEGLIKLLSIVADNGPARPVGLVDEWGDYLSRCSAYGTESTIKDTMRRRLKNLLERGLVERKGTLYSATSDGLAYLQITDDQDAEGRGDQHDVWTLVRQQENSVRERILEMLRDMDAFDLEHLVKRLLEEMNYQNVEVTARSGDGGVDVVGDIELGITSVCEVVQVKRHRKAIQRKDLDALRGSLYRFNAVRGTIVTTSRFAKGAQEAAFATGVAPITLIDSDKLVDLLIAHGIGVRKRKIELLEVETEAFDAINEND